MKVYRSIVLIVVVMTASQLARASELTKDYPVQAVPFTKVHVADEFWSPRLETNRAVTIPYAFEKCEETGRIDNFAIAGGLKPGKFRGIYFNDSDVFKIIEGAAYSLAIHPDPELDAYVDGVIAKIAAAQEPDGYLYTARTLCGEDYMPPGGKERWSDIGSGHELYNVGHLYEAAVAHYLATGKRTLLDVAIKNADLVCSVFGPGRRQDPPGHEEIEIGLARLYRATGDEKYLATAKFFLDARGRADGHRLYGSYSQDHQPVVEQTAAVGHAVRAGYLYSGMADVAALTGDADYVKAIDRIWEDVVGRKLYITGGIGARGGGEAFGDDYELPNLRAYAETCAAIANALWNHRMFLMSGDGKYMDVVERVIYNGFLSGVSLEGDRFFYPNPLESHSGASRAPWFGCACCPSNVARFVPSIPGYVYARRGDTLYVNLFIAGSATADVGENTVRVTQETRYPWDGTVKITIEPAKSPASFAVLVRIPGWARNQPVPSDLYRYMNGFGAAVALRVNGEPRAVELEKGFARTEREWRKGDVIELELPMPVRRVLAHERVRDDVGRVAIERGPIVYCAEGVDNQDGRVLSLILPDDAELRADYRKDLLDGLVAIRGRARVVNRTLERTAVLDDEQELVLIPYYAWAHRERGQMAVWLARDVAAAKPLPAPTIAHTSRVTVSFGGAIEALTDQLEPASSIDHSNPFFHWWSHKGTQEWVQYDFRQPAKVAAVEVYWFDDTGIGECRLPESWRLLAKVGGQWREVSNPGGYGVEKDKYNRTTFDPVEAEGLRLEVQLPEKFSAGIHEWRVCGEVLTGTASLAAQEQGVNVLPNPSFEEEISGQPASWRPERWGGEGEFDYARIGRSGKRSVTIASERGADVGWACTVPVEPYATYRLSGWIKAENVETQGSRDEGTEGPRDGGTEGRGALLNIHNIQPVATPAVTGTRDWTQVEVVFETGDEDAVQVNCLFGGWGLATGRAWYDDVRLELVSQQAVPAPRIVIDADKTGQPISKYIYGQFIEHLGRCIYGGIWAEILEDRKFFYPVGSNESPWKPVGGPDVVTMVDENAFVGEHTPQITLAGDGQPHGVAHDGLGLLSGKDYVGRIWLAGSPDAGPVRVSLIWGGDSDDRETISIDKLTDTYTKMPLRFTAGGSTDDGRLEITAAGKGHFRVGTVSLMPADNVHGMRADTLAVLRQLDAPVYRWPGGNFVSGYNWKDGIGAPDRRPPRKNPAWQGIEHNDFGIDEFITFCRVLGTEPYVVVNSGLGDVALALEEVQYANGGVDTPMGKLRAQNGHAEPYAVKFWGIGNEMYGGWQLGHMPLEQYIEKHNQFAEAMRAVDPSITLVAVGAVGAWSEGMLKHCADHMDLISEHFYCSQRPGLNGHMRQIPGAVRRIADAHRQYRREFETLEGKDIRIALDEWNYWYGPQVFGELGARYFLKDGLGIAAGLHEYARNSNLFFMANYAQTVNVIGCAKTSKTAAAFETTGLVLKLYREHFGVVPVATETTPLLDAQAAWSEDRRTLTVGIVNPSLKEREIALELRGAKLTGAGKRWQIAGDPMAYNDPGRSPGVTIEEARVEGISDRLTVAPCSVTLFALRVR